MTDQGARDSSREELCDTKDSPAGQPVLTKRMVEDNDRLFVLEKKVEALTQAVIRLEREE